MHSPGKATKPLSKNFCGGTGILESADFFRREQRLDVKNRLYEKHMKDTSRNSKHWEDLRPYVDDAVNALPERDRQVILWRYFEGYSFREIGQMLGVSEDASQ